MLILIRQVAATKPSTQQVALMVDVNSPRYDLLAPHFLPFSSC